MNQGVLTVHRIFDYLTKGSRIIQLRLPQDFIGNGVTRNTPYSSSSIFSKSFVTRIHKAVMVSPYSQFFRIPNAHSIIFALQELPPYLKDFLNGPNSSPISRNRFFANTVVNYPELRHRLNKLSSCFKTSFYLPGLPDGDLASSTASSPFHNGAAEGSNTMLDNLSEQTMWPLNASRDRMYPGPSPKDNSDLSFSPGSESDSTEHGALFSETRSRQSNRTSLWTIASGRGKIDTASRIEAVVWRHILAGVSHHLLCTLVSNGKQKEVWFLCHIKI